MINELCSKLAQKRNELGLSIEEVVEKTKLYPSVVRDIEAGNLSNINPAYLKGFVKIYASFLGVDIGDTFSQNTHTKVTAKERTSSTAKISSGKDIKLAMKAIPTKIKKIVLLCLFGLFILWSLTVFVRFIAKKISHLPKKPAKKVERSVSPRISSSVVKAKEIIVSVTAKRNCFLKVKVDGKVLFDGMLRKGIADTWNGYKEIEFKINDGSAVNLEVNGKRLPSLTSARKPIKSLKITASGISVVK